MKQYLGDGVYAEFDNQALNIILTTEDGIKATNTIVLEPDVLDNLGTFVKRAVYKRNGIQSLERGEVDPRDQDTHVTQILTIDRSHYGSVTRN